MRKRHTLQSDSTRAAQIWRRSVYSNWPTRGAPDRGWSLIWSLYPYDHWLTNKAHLSNIALTNISEEFYLQVGGKNPIIDYRLPFYTHPIIDYRMGVERKPPCQKPPHPFSPSDGTPTCDRWTQGHRVKRRPVQHKLLLLLQTTVRFHKGDSDVILFHVYASWFLPPTCR